MCEMMIKYDKFALSRWKWSPQTNNEIWTLKSMERKDISFARITWSVDYNDGEGKFVFFGPFFSFFEKKYCEKCPVWEIIYKNMVKLLKYLPWSCRRTSRSESSPTGWLPAGFIKVIGRTWVWKESILCFKHLLTALWLTLYLQSCFYNK